MPQTPEDPHPGFVVVACVSADVTTGTIFHMQCYDICIPHVPKQQRERMHYMAYIPIVDMDDRHTYTYYMLHMYCEFWPIKTLDDVNHEESGAVIITFDT